MANRDILTEMLNICKHSKSAICCDILCAAFEFYFELDNVNSLI